MYNTLPVHWVMAGLVVDKSLVGVHNVPLIVRSLILPKSSSFLFLSAFCTDIFVVTLFW